MTGKDSVSASVTIAHVTGLHARPAVKFTKLAKTFANADIKVKGGDGQTWTNAKSITRVMALKLRQGAVLDLVAEGSDAEAAVMALKDLVERNFDEGG